MMKSLRSLHLLLFIGMICVMDTMALVCPYSDPACQSCDDESVSCNDLSVIPPLNSGPGVRQVKYVTLTTGNIISITRNSLPHGLISLTLKGHPLTNISEYAFDTSAATLERIHISKAKFNGLSQALKKLTKLTHLSVEDTGIQVWDTALLKHIGGRLEVLELKNVGLSSWPSWISGSPLLQRIVLNGNPIKNIPDDAFSSFKDSLHTLYLVDTGLTQIPSALSNLSNLRSLTLSNNKLTHVSEIEKITGAPFAQKLSKLRLSSVGFNQTANFSNLTSLEILDLHSNRIQDVPAGSLPATLVELNLLANLLHSVPADIASMSRLFYLALSRNRIAIIEPDIFPLHLSYLDLHDNNVTSITNTTFRNHSLLSSLNLNFNPISMVSPGGFSHLVSLSILYLIYTSLTEIPLALTRLSPQTDVYFTCQQPLPCPCPAPLELVQWFRSLKSNGNIQGSCSNGQSLQSYLRGQCGQTSATP